MNARRDIVLANPSVRHYVTLYTNTHIVNLSSASDMDMTLVY